MRVLVIAAHPDDEVYGMGGTMAKLAEKGNEVFVLIVTEGCSTQYPGNKDIIEIKKEEARKANSILGVKEVIFGDLPDMKLDTIPHVEINKLIEKTINYIKPQVVYTHHRGDVNKDHKLVYESTLVATRPTHTQDVKEVICYSVPSSTEWTPNVVKDMFMPNIFEDIEEQYENKKKSIIAYNSEIREAPHPRSIEVVITYDKSVGMKVGIGKAEAFQLIRKVN